VKPHEDTEVAPKRQDLEAEATDQDVCADAFRGTGPVVRACDAGARALDQAGDNVGRDEKPREESRGDPKDFVVCGR
jgi:hypothetical protein